MSLRAPTPRAAAVAPPAPHAPQYHADLPAFPRPELNPVENIWQFMRGNWLSNLVFDTYDDIIDVACDAWRKLIAQPDTITSSACAIGPTSVKPHNSWY